ncbi:hypothetical protein OQJ13_09320 [Legionella sp. PATHC035]|uniref:hypothetical protein n=1 Tax=Legionella sp. PATHC035 TaxID=2992040 RepID=UPI0022438218|nr:hypothetical protein [Legionella sp. PATHC035]MCW8409171.1 hypothetical protein [Legionella sp. PATHC035]
MLYSKFSKACLGTTLSFALVMPCYALTVTTAAQAKAFAVAPTISRPNSSAVTSAAMARYKMAGFNTIVTGKGAGSTNLTTLRRVSTAKTAAPAAAVPAATAPAVNKTTRGVFLGFKKR